MAKKKKLSGVWNPLPIGEETIHKLSEKNRKKNLKRKRAKGNHKHSEEKFNKKRLLLLGGFIIPEQWNRKIYKKYLTTKWWKLVRNKKFSSVQYKCERCHEKAQQVHHKHYKSITREKNHDLEALCCLCHQKEHSLI